MAFLNRKIRAIYAGAFGALGLAVGSALDPLSSRSQDDPAMAAPIELKAARTAKPAGGTQRPPHPCKSWSNGGSKESRSSGGAPVPSRTGARSTGSRASFRPVQLKLEPEQQHELELELQLQLQPEQ